jgi:hypothetical protein
MFLENEDNGRFGKEELNGKLVIEWGGWPLSRRTPISNINFLYRVTLKLLLVIGCWQYLLSFVSFVIQYNCICYYMCINPIIVCNWLY